MKQPSGCSTGIIPEMRSFDSARDTLSRHWGSKQSFDWHDVAIRQTEDHELYVTTARSEAIMLSGSRYATDYVMLTRARDGVIVEHTEYFDPLPIIDLLGSAK